MTVDELTAALDELAALDLPAATREILESIMVDSLIRKDPELALNRFIDRFEDLEGSLVQSLINGFTEWAKKHQDQAIAWLDRRLADGAIDVKSLDGSNSPRSQLEVEILDLLLPTDPATAGRRLKSLPGAVKMEILDRYAVNRIKPENYANFGSLVRSQLPEKEQLEAIVRPFYKLIQQDGYSQFNEYLDRVEASPAEKDAAVALAAQLKFATHFNEERNFPTEEMDAMRDWAASQSPETVDRITADALIGISQNGHDSGFQNAADLALHYQQTTGNDEILATFLESPAALANQEQSRILAEKITDETRRSEILQRLEPSGNP